MAPSMDIDENDDGKTTSSTAKNPPKKPPSRAASGTPSASAEQASRYPSMSLAQDIHRLIVFYGSPSVGSGKLDSEGASAVGFEPEKLLEKVMLMVGTGGKSAASAIAEAAKKISGEGDGDGDKNAKAAAETDAKDTNEDEGEEILLNASLYRHLQSVLPYPSPTTPPSHVLSEADLALIDDHHKAMMASLDLDVTKAKEEAGDMEVLSAHMSIARYAAKSLTKEEALEAYEKVVKLPKLSVGKITDALLEKARVASFWGDWKRMKETLDEAAKHVANGGDWDRRNRLKVYQALSFLLVRDMQSASTLLVDGIATFSCTELCDYPEFITYTIVTNLLFLPRPELKKNIIDGSEILQVAREIPVVVQLANTLYSCDYKQYLHTLVALHPHLIANRYLQPHAGYLLRELHVLGFKQFLDSYQSVTLESMAASFGVGTEFLDLQLSRFIAAGRLTAKIDKFGGVVETNRPDWKNARYRDMIQKGDLLLNRIQKLGRVVDL